MNQEKQEKKSFLPNLEENLMGISVAIALVTMLLSFFAQFFASPETVAAIQQVCYYSYAWVIGFALAICARDNRYLRAPMVESHLPQAAQKVLRVIQEVIATVILLILLVAFCQLTMNTLAEGTMDKKAIFLPLSLAYIAPTVGFVLANVRHIYRLVKGGK